jgi:hypothetical protein
VAILLPADSPAKLSFRKVGGVMAAEPEFGGAMTRFQRLPRWAVDVDMPPLSYPEAMKWFTRLTKGDVTPLRLPLVQPELEMRGRAGALAVDGANQSGMTVNIRGGNQNYLIREGQWLPLTLAAKGRSYLYMVDEDVRINALGKAAVKLTTPLRRRPADGDALNVEKPVIEGFTDVNPGWTVESFCETSIRFTLTEVE